MRLRAVQILGGYDDGPKIFSQLWHDGDGQSLRGRGIPSSMGTGSWVCIAERRRTHCCGTSSGNNSGQSQRIFWDSLRCINRRCSAFHAALETGLLDGRARGCGVRFEVASRPVGFDSRSGRCGSERTVERGLPAFERVDAWARERPKTRHGVAAWRRVLTRIRCFHYL